MSITSDFSSPYHCGGHGVGASDRVGQTLEAVPLDVIPASKTNKNFDDYEYNQRMSPSWKTSEGPHDLAIMFLRFTRGDIPILGVDW